MTKPEIDKTTKELMARLASQPHKPHAPAKKEAKQKLAAKKNAGA